MVTVLAGLHEPSLSTISFIKGGANTKNHSKKLIERNQKRFHGKYSLNKLASPGMQYIASDPKT